MKFRKSKKKNQLMVKKIKIKKNKIGGTQLEKKKSGEMCKK